MPELPEVETTRRLLEPHVAGCRVRSVRVLHPRMVRRQPEPADFASRLTGRKVYSLGRRGKFLLFEVGDRYTWVTHLGMSGRLALARSHQELDPHTRVIFEIAEGVEVRMVDVRTFGFTTILTPAELADSTLSRLGPDALTALPDAGYLSRTAAGRSVAIKNLLLDQSFLAGLGNIYANEALFEAGVDGARPSGSLQRDEMEAIRRAIESVLAAGLEHGGTSLADLAYLLPDGRAGRHLEYLAVYGREDRPCRRCGCAIRRSVLGNRSTFHCPVCQL